MKAATKIFSSFKKLTFVFNWNFAGRYHAVSYWDFRRFVFPCHSTAYVLLLQSALQPLWVMACSTIVEYSQPEGFYSVPLPAARQTPYLEDQ